LNEHEAGVSVADLARQHGFAEGTLYTWKSKVGGMEVLGLPLRQSWNCNSQPSRCRRALVGLRRNSRVGLQSPWVDSIAE
jgi:hypothetical protein